MSKKVKKQTADMSFSLSRWFRKLSSSKPSAGTFTAIVLILAIFLFAGSIFTVTDSGSFISRLTSAYINNRFYFLAVNSIGGGLSEQFTAEPVIAGALYAMGFIGMLLMYRSTKSAYKPRNAYMTMIIGVSLILLAYIFLEGSIIEKLTG
jgi:hypothetical protein